VLNKAKTNGIYFKLGSTLGVIIFLYDNFWVQNVT